jgi:mono/diheme cytochrome c family protein
MRELWARRLAILTGVVVVALSALIATRFEAAALEGEVTPVAETASVDPALVARGAEVYQAEGCAGCHAIAGEGNPRNPLDGVGARLSPEELLHWTIAAPEVADRMPRRTAMMKQGYAELDEADLEALVAYLRTLR